MTTLTEAGLLLACFTMVLERHDSVARTSSCSFEGSAACGRDQGHAGVGHTSQSDLPHEGFDTTCTCCQETPYSSWDSSAVTLVIP